ncbi:MAG: helix-turn-helix domain-containing protein [Prevotellaceae bacterium]|jgi:transcriptional regulator with XRE-family HTH domain|nr:helix-turn-helix domain-containing protein [Prevotellaceae bacterium]
MEKLKLIETRKNKGYSQMYMAEKLCVDESNYCRRERGQSKISFAEWTKLANILGVSIEDIFEAEESQFFICKDSASGNYQGTNNIYSVPESLLETQQKYIQKLEEEIRSLKELLKKADKN